jgi:hypothetical protein
VLVVLLLKAPGLGNGPTLRATDTVNSFITGVSRVIKVKGAGPVNQKGGSKGTVNSEPAMPAVVVIGLAASPSEVSIQQVPPQTPGSLAHANGSANSDLADQSPAQHSGSPVLISEPLEQEPSDAENSELHGLNSVSPTATKRRGR